MTGHLEYTQLTPKPGLFKLFAIDSDFWALLTSLPIKAKFHIEKARFAIDSVCQKYEQIMTSSSYQLYFFTLVFFFKKQI